MTEPQITITLGRRSGQKVVKDSIENFGGGPLNARVPSGSRRSLAESFGILPGHSYNHSYKRTRDDVNELNYECEMENSDSCLDPRDLRLKLRRKRISHHVEHEIEKQKRMELHEKVTRAIRSLESPERSLFTNIPSPRRAVEPPRMDSITSSYSPWAANGGRPVSPSRVSMYSSGFSTPNTSFIEMPYAPSTRASETSRTSHLFMRDPLESSGQRVPLPTFMSDSLEASRIKVPLPTLMNEPLESSMYRMQLPATSITTPVQSGNLVREHSTATSGMPMAHYLDNRSLTVNSLLYSLGLGKYVINFQAEEIDMIALKQMGERDLKELGIPMGPRKKLLLALHPPGKHPQPFML